MIYNSSFKHRPQLKQIKMENYLKELRFISDPNRNSPPTKDKKEKSSKLAEQPNQSNAESLTNT